VRVAIVLLTIRLAAPLHVNCTSIDANLLFLYNIKKFNLNFLQLDFMRWDKIKYNHAIGVAELFADTTTRRLKVIREAALVRRVLKSAPTVGDISIVGAAVAIECRSVVNLRRVFSIVVRKHVLCSDQV
jgi:hypothetical protein